MNNYFRTFFKPLIKQKIYKTYNRTDWNYQNKEAENVLQNSQHFKLRSDTENLSFVYQTF